MEPRRMAMTLLAIVVTTVLALVYVGLEVKSVQLGYRLKLNEQEIERVRDEHQTLKYNLTALESPVRLEKVLAADPHVDTRPANFQVVKVRNGTE